MVVKRCQLHLGLCPPCHFSPLDFARHLLPLELADTLNMAHLAYVLQMERFAKIYYFMGENGVV